MAEHFTENAENNAVNGCLEASRHFETIAGPRAIGDTLKSAVNSIVAEIRRATGYAIKPSRVEDIWRREARRIDWHEMDAIRATAALKEIRDEKYEADLTEVLARLAALEEVALRKEQGLPPRFGDAPREAVDVVERVLGGGS